MATESENIQKAIKEAGCKPQNAIFFVAFDWGTSGGTFTASFNGQTTAPVAFPPTAAAFQAAMISLITVGEAGAEVSGAIGGPYEIEMTGGNAGQVVPDLVIDGSDLTPAQEPLPEITQQGDSGKYQAEAEKLWTDNADASSEKMRFLLVKKGLLELRLGKASGNVDVTTGQANRTEVKQSQEYYQIENLLQRTEAAIAAEGRSQGQAGRKTFGGVMRRTTTNGLRYGQMGIDENGNLR